MVSKRQIVTAIGAVIAIAIILSLLMPQLYLPPPPHQRPYDDVPDWGTGITVGSDEDNPLENFTYNDLPMNFSWQFDPTLNLTFDPTMIVAIASPAEPPRYWKQTAYDTYTGSNWVKNNNSLVNLPEVDPGSEIIYTITQNITHQLTGDLPLLSLWPDPMIIRNSINNPYLPFTNSYDLLTDEYGTAILRGRFSANATSTLQYQVTYTPRDWQTIRPLSQSSSLTPSSLMRYQSQGLNQLSASTRTSIQSQLTAILAGVPDIAFEEAFVILDYFKNTFVFDPLIPRPGPSDEAVDWFLQQGGGIGLDFASAYTIFLRMNNIAARPVVGVILGENQGTQRVLRLMHLHFWVEVYIPTGPSTGYWIQFDPTPLPSYITDGSPPPGTPPPPDEDPFVVSTNYNLTVNIPTPIVNRGELFQVIATLTKDGNPEPNETLEFYDDTENWFLGSNVTTATGEARITFSFDNSAIVGNHLLRVSFHNKRTYGVIILRGPTSLTFSAIPFEVNRTAQISYTGLLQDAVNGRGLSINETWPFGVSIYLNAQNVTQTFTDATGAYSIFYPIPSDQDPLGITTTYAEFLYPGITSATSPVEFLNITATSRLSVSAIPNSVRNNSNTILSGRLLYENSTGIMGQVVQLYWNGTPIGSNTTDSQGYYMYNYTPTEIGFVFVEARFASGNYIWGSIAYTSVRVHEEGTIAVFVQEDVSQRGSVIQISGWVEDQAGNPRPGETVLIYFNSSQVVQNITQGDGSFDITYQIIGSQSVGFFEVTGNITSLLLRVISTVDYLTINSTTSMQNLQFDEVRVMAGETTAFSGQIVDDQGVGVPSQSLTVYLVYLSTRIPVGGLITQLDGSFTFPFTIPTSIPQNVPTVAFEAVFAGSTYYGSSNNSQTLDIFTNATLSIQLPSFQGPIQVPFTGTPIWINGTLLDNFQRPLPNRPVNLLINNSTTGSVVTNIQGRVSLNLTLYPPPTPLQRLNYTIQLQHQTVTNISSGVETITVEAIQMQQPFGIPLEIIILIVGVIIIAIITFFGYRYWKRRPRRTRIPSVDAAAMLTSLRQLLTEKKYRESVIYAFRMFETIVQARLGIFRDPSITVREYGNLAIAQGRLDTRNMEVFVRGVEEARFSDHPMSYNSALTTLNAFANIYNSLIGGNLRFVTQEEQPQEE